MRSWQNQGLESFLWLLLLLIIYYCLHYAKLHFSFQLNGHQLLLLLLLLNHHDGKFTIIYANSLSFWNLSLKHLNFIRKFHYLNTFRNITQTSELRNSESNNLKLNYFFTYRIFSSNHINICNQNTIAMRSLLTVVIHFYIWLQFIPVPSFHTRYIKKIKEKKQRN